MNFVWMTNTVVTKLTTYNANGAYYHFRSRLEWITLADVAESTRNITNRPFT